MKRNAFLFLLSLGLFACQSKETPLTAQQIVDKSIKAAQAEKVSNTRICFDFRNRTYEADRDNGAFVLKRTTHSDASSVTDVLSNNGFQRLLDNELIQIPDSMALKYSESVNSVHYFSILPYGLNDGAVNKKLLPEVQIKGKDYYKVEVTFDQQGGGVDFEDVFVYWIDKETFQVDYLAYLFHVNGGGVRFREVRKEHVINGIRFADYNNYKPDNPKIDVRDTDKAFENGELKKVSEINLENLQVFPSLINL